MGSNFLKVSKGINFKAQASPPSDPMNGDVYFDETLGSLRSYKNGTWISLDEPGLGSVTFFYDNFENGNVENWATYANAAAATPVDGTGGTATTLTVTASSSSPLNGTFSMSIAKSAANGQGQGVAASFAIPSGYQQGAKRVLEFLWDGSDANYATGDMRVYIFDVTNSTLITPEVSPQLPAAKTPIQLSWDASSSASYRLIFHVATTNASAWTVKIDDVNVGPGEVIPVPASGYLGPIAVTTSLTGGHTVTARAWREHNLIYVRGKIALTGNNSDAALYVYLPSGLNFDSSDPLYASEAVISGSSTYLDASGFSRYEGTVAVRTANHVQLFYSSTSAASNYVNSVGSRANASGYPIPSSPWVSGDMVWFEFKAPIAEWADSPSYVASAKQAVVSTKVRNSTNQTFTMNNFAQTINNDLIVFNQGGGSWSNGVYTVPESGTYFITSSMTFSGLNVSSTARYGLYVYVNSSINELASHYPEVAGKGFNVKFASPIKLTKGDQVLFRAYSNANHSSNGLTQDLCEYNTTSIVRTHDEYGNPVVGFGYVTQDSAGLVKKAGQLLGTTSTTPAPSGYVGEYISSSNTNVPTTSANYVTAVELSFLGVAPGDFDISAAFNVTNSITTSTDTRGTALLTSPSDSSSGGQTLAFTDLRFPVITGTGATSQSIGGSFPQIRATWDGTDITLYRGSSTEIISGHTIAIRVYMGVYSAGSAGASGFISARRVR